MGTLKIRWCQRHESVVFRPADDPDDYWLCEASNLSGNTDPCEVVDAEVTTK